MNELLNIGVFPSRKPTLSIQIDNDPTMIEKKGDNTFEQGVEGRDVPAFDHARGRVGAFRPLWTRAKFHVNSRLSTQEDLPHPCLCLGNIGFHSERAETVSGYRVPCAFP
jgi:hypothetical protein